MVSPPKYRAAVAFSAGWLSVFAWLFTTASANLFCASLCINLATLKNPDYVPTQWQTYLIYTAFIIICTSIVVYLPRTIPRLETFFFWTSLLGFLVNTIVLLAVSPTKTPTTTVFTTWSNLTGWDSGVAMMLAIGQSMYGFLCTDSISHISEELHNPSRYVPRAMWMTIAIGIATTIPFTLAILYSAPDYDSIAASALPIMEVYIQSLRGNTSAALFFTFWILFIYFGATIGLVLTSGRLLWAFARDNGLPYSPIFAHTDPTLKIPRNATFLTAAFCILYGLVYIGSTTAFNSFVATAILSLNITYTIPQTITLLRGRSVLPEREFSLDARHCFGVPVGTICNVFATCWTALYSVLFCFPIFLPVEPGTMNYVVVVMAGTGLFIVVAWWLPAWGKRRVFTGPDVDAEALQRLSAINRGIRVGSVGKGDAVE
jgi:choline transport protein